MFCKYGKKLLNLQIVEWLREERGCCLALFRSPLFFPIRKHVYFAFTLHKCLHIDNRVKFVTIGSPYNSSTISKFNFFKPSISTFRGMSKIVKSRFWKINCVNYSKIVIVSSTCHHIQFFLAEFLAFVVFFHISLRD